MDILENLTTVRGSGGYAPLKLPVMMPFSV